MKNNPMFTIFWRTIKDRKFSLLSYVLIAIALMWMYVSLFPSIQKQAESLLQLMKSYPEGLMKIFGGGNLNFTSLENFLALEQFSIMWPILVIFMLVSLAGSAISEEIEKGTIEILLSRPVSRLQIFMNKYLAGIFFLFIFTVTSVFSVIPLAELYNIDYIWKNYFTLALLAFLFGWAVFSISMLFSAIFSERSKTYMFSAFILLAMYVLNLVSVLKENLGTLKYFSLFYYFNYSDALIHNKVELLSILVPAATVLITTLVAAVWFNKRNIAAN